MQDINSVSCRCKSELLKLFVTQREVTDPIR